MRVVMNKERTKFRRAFKNPSCQLNNNEELVNFVIPQADFA